MKRRRSLLQNFSSKGVAGLNGELNRAEGEGKRVFTAYVSLFHFVCETLTVLVFFVLFNQHVPGHVTVLPLDMIDPW